MTHLDNKALNSLVLTINDYCYLNPKNQGSNPYKIREVNEYKNFVFEAFEDFINEYQADKTIVLKEFTAFLIMEWLRDEFKRGDKRVGLSDSDSLLTAVDVFKNRWLRAGEI